MITLYALNYTNYFSIKMGKKEKFLKIPLALNIFLTAITMNKVRYLKTSFKVEEINNRSPY